MAVIISRMMMMMMIIIIILWAVQYVYNFYHASSTRMPSNGSQAVRVSVRNTIHCTCEHLP